MSALFMIVFNYMFDFELYFDIVPIVSGPRMCHLSKIYCFIFL